MLNYNSNTYQEKNIDLFENFSQNDSGLLVPDYLKKSVITCLDLFSGCGGFSLGVMRAGMCIKKNQKKEKESINESQQKIF